MMKKYRQSRATLEIRLELMPTRNYYAPARERVFCNHDMACVMGGAATLTPSKSGMISLPAVPPADARAVEHRHPFTLEPPRRAGGITIKQSILVIDALRARRSSHHEKRKKHRHRPMTVGLGGFGHTWPSSIGI